jgi:hypothetical protein
MRPSTDIDGGFTTLTRKRAVLVIAAILGFLVADVASVIIMLFWL